MLNSRQVRGCRVALVVAAFGLGQAGAQTGNFVQIRGLWPPEDGSFSSAGALDAALRLPLGETGNFGLRLQQVSSLRQRGQLELNLGAAFAGLVFRREPGAVPGSTTLELDVLGLYTAPVGDGLNLLGDASFAYSLDLEAGGTTPYELQGGAAGLAGDFSDQFHWNLDYRLVSDLNPVHSRTEHDLEAWVRSPLLESVLLGVGVGLAADAKRLVYRASLEASLAVSELDRFGVRLTLTTAPGDEERLFYSTARLAPASLELFVGRSNDSFLIWGLTLSGAAVDGLRLDASYEGRAGPRASQDLSLGLGYGGSAGSLGLRGGLNLEFDADSGLWFGRLVAQLTARLAFETFSLEATGRLDYGADRLIGRFTAEASLTQGPWVATLTADLKYQNQLLGTVSLEGLYFFLPNLGVNLTGLYRWSPASQLGSGFGFGLGLRLGF